MPIAYNDIVTKVMIACNPNAGQREKQEELGLVAAEIERQGWELCGLEMAPTPEAMTAIARSAAESGCDMLFVAGGDGTVARAVDGLLGSDTALALLPAGTGNVLARQFRLPVPGGFRLRPMLDSMPFLIDGRRRRVDVGRVTLNDGTIRHFLCWAGVGFDAQVTKTVDDERERKRRLGMAAFVIATVMTLSHFSGTRATVRVDGRRVRQRMIMLVANNIQLYGGWIKMAPEALLDDGWLDVYTFRGRDPLRTFWRGLRLLIDRRAQVPQISCFRARRTTVVTGRRLPVQVDGDTIGYTPVAIQVVPAALNLLVPSCAPPGLFKQA